MALLASVPIMSKISRWDPPPVEVTSGYVIPGVAREIRHLERWSLRGIL